MTNQLIIAKLGQRINKLSSLDYDNLEPWMRAEAINKAQDNWTRRQLEGINQTRTGAEGSIRRIDDLQSMITVLTDTFVDKGLYWESSIYPSDYMEWCRISASAIHKCETCCPPRPLVIFMGNEADVDICLSDTNRQPSYEWATTFCTVMSKKFKIWTNGEFGLSDVLITYYRQPRKIVFINSVDPYTGLVSAVDVECEFPDNIVELIIDEAAAILSGDMDAFNQVTRLNGIAEHNN
jgi:hypothetical protein